MNETIKTMEERGFKYHYSRWAIVNSTGLYYMADSIWTDNIERALTGSRMFIEPYALYLRSCIKDVEFIAKEVEKGGWREK